MHTKLKKWLKTQVFGSKGNFSMESTSAPTKSTSEIFSPWSFLLTFLNPTISFVFSISLN